MPLFQVEEKCREYNQIGMTLQMIPQEATNACGVDYELKPNNVHMKFAAVVKVIKGLPYAVYS
jgi:hypothetical protein